MKKAISQEAVNDSSHSRIPEGNESNTTASSFRSAAMLGIALSVGASGVVVSQTKASAAVTAPTTSAKTEAFSSNSRVLSPVPEDASLQIAGYHTVGSGESLWQISHQHRVGLRELKSVNGLPEETSIAVGQVLKVPEMAPEMAREMVEEVGGEAQAAQTMAIADITADTTKGSEDLSEKISPEITLSSDNQLPQQSIQQSSIPQNTDEPTAAAQVSTPAPSIQIEIAEAIAQAETADNDLPVITTALATPSTATNPQANGQSRYQASYQVRAGDTLSSIATSLGTTSAALIRANGLSNPNVIYAGATLRVPAAQLAAPNQSLTSQSQLIQPSQQSQQLASKAASPTASTSNSEQLRSATEQLAALRSPANRPDDARLLAEIRNASPQEAASVGGEQVSAQDVLSARAEETGSADPYVADLLEEVEGIGDSSSQVAEIDSSKQMASVPEDNTPINNPLSSRPVAPDRSSQQVAISNSSAAANSELLAAAPLNPDTYIPAQRSQTGQVVSPDMPLLPSSDQYLPEAPNRFNGYIWPARGTVTSGYGWRWGRMHRGVDVAGPVGTPIVAAAPGVVEQAGWNSGGYGNLVEIRHPDGSMTRYAHNSRLNVSSGQEVAQGQQIAEMGSTGYSTGPHLHFEMHPNGGGAVNPVAYLPSR